MAVNLLRLSFASKRIPCSALMLQRALYHAKSKIGKREIVGFGFNGEANYVDRADFPMPAIRFREVTPELTNLREKEKGDWKKLTLEEKKTLYRASFCQTFAEMNAPSGDWKLMISGILISVSLAIWFYVWMQKFVYGPLPPTYSAEAQEAQLQRLIDLRANPIEGVSSKYDYDKNRWM